LIYSFAISDRRKESFIQMLQEAGIDYEVSVHDAAVVRVLGALTGDLREKLDKINKSAPELKIKRKEETGCYAEILKRQQLTIIAGPCAVEDEEQLAETAARLSVLGVRYLRAGAFKPRTSVDSFQGLGKPGLELLRKYADLHGMFVVTEVMDRSQIDTVAHYADILQVGSRNMFNYTLLTALGSMRKPVLLKRGMAATIDEWLSAAEYISRGGNNEIILCERGIRTFEPQVAHTLDIAAIVLVKQQTPYPVIADASHAAGRSDLVAPLAKAATAAGADGIMLEVHPQPQRALSDGKQALTLEQIATLLPELTRIFAVKRV
jgi:3-deoxy-7-phosphoheptulonate synthase